MAALHAGSDRLRAALAGMALLASGAASGQPAPTDAQPAPPQIAVGADATPDAAIAERLRGLLAVLPEFEDVDVQVREGVVFFGGSVAETADVERLEALAKRLSEAIAAAAGDEPDAQRFKQDYAALAAELGLTDVKAVGMSSAARPEGGFHNRIFYLLPEPRRGAFAALGGPARPFATARLAPADTDLFVTYGTDEPPSARESVRLDVPTGFVRDRRNAHKVTWHETFSGGRTISVDLAPRNDTVAELRGQGQMAVYGDASREAILGAADVGRASHLVLTLPQSADRAAIVSAALLLSSSQSIATPRTSAGVHSCSPVITLILHSVRGSG